MEGVGSDSSAVEKQSVSCVGGATPSAKQGKSLLRSSVTSSAFDNFLASIRPSHHKTGVILDGGEGGYVRMHGPQKKRNFSAM